MESTLLTAEDVAKQLRIKKYTVYELIKRGELPSSKVGKQVRISQTDIDRYLELSKTGPQYSELRSPDPGRREFAEQPGPGAGLSRQAPGGEGESGESRPSAASVIISGQDICLDLLVARLAGEGIPILRSFVGCYNGLYSLYHGRVTMSASHLWDGETDTYNYPFIRRLLPGLPVGVFRLLGRMEGLYVRKGNPQNIRDWKDFSRPGLTMVNRERGSGARILLDQKLALLGINAAKIQGYTRESSSHLACASTVAKGGAEVGYGCERGIDRVAGVEFIPLQMEWYDFVFRLEDRHNPAIRIVSAYIASDEFKKDLELMGGYDISQTGHYEEFSV
ncbi:molybdate-binding protein [Treponema primitia ZAS-2]|uniref:Molybdate-binding protein n=1 Tax=Treponema primitia (strain ATCC BAA-887 / DSM 12427 / ZAS-2) TaxID=545694 RepID=F5YH62_TREPZ|nr:helix-turn-helix transcriptional regulator [Treponema primitia]AEF85489.1 molybdate-binding protein [Treponema primitia ZAS-2]